MLLGIDIGKTFEVSAKIRRIEIDGMSSRIPCIVVKSCTQARKVYVWNSYNILPLSEMIMEIHLPTNDGEDRLTTWLPMDAVLAHTERQSYGEYVDYIRDNLYKTHNLARKHLRQSSQSQEEHYDTKAHLNICKPDDSVWYLTKIRNLSQALIKLHRTLFRPQNLQCNRPFNPVRCHW